MNEPKDGDENLRALRCSSSAEPNECSWCGDPLDGKKSYGNRIHPSERFCSRSYRDASTAAVKRLRENVKA